MNKPEKLGRIRATVEAVIRPCHEDDLPALEWMGLYTRHRHIIREAFEAQERGDALLLLAVAADFPIAQVWIDFARDGTEGTAFLWAIRTFFPLQRAGIGRQMMAAAESVLQDRGIRRAELEVERDNQAVLRFYQKLGWHVVGLVGETTDPRQERLLLAKQLPLPREQHRLFAEPIRQRGVSK